MSRSNNKTPSANKNSLPQTPKGLKIAPENVSEEFARELAAHGDTISKRELNRLKLNKNK
ncbi:YfhD family protein [Jeotgalibacillus proteolyticus]|uniref:YfhD family protein n=1 Tax=Jeotgalibacillus proteolyticus TaxID=2082395 RepID=A0A2S5G7G2_9BACL|nr:YfhD family protein [Jeotgalibacillus proteolyticus]PPA68927.1 YfhD family protein [Jeotgalibacillus proteolyticus]